MKRFIFLAAILIGLSALCRADIIAYPNPWIPDDVHSARGNHTDGIRFRNITTGVSGDIYVYTISGNQVKHIVFTNFSNAAPVKWLGKNDNDEDVASGVYLWVVKADQTTTGKIVVVR